MRGKGQGITLTKWETGITPAYAGKSDRYLCINHCKQDHPRLCGEKQLHKLFKLHLSGSPPPMRGKACDKRKFRHWIRITPAYAGKRL